MAGAWEAKEKIWADCTHSGLQTLGVPFIYLFKHFIFK